MPGSSRPYQTKMLIHQSSIAKESSSQWEILQYRHLCRSILAYQMIRHIHMSYSRPYHLTRVTKPYLSSSYSRTLIGYSSYPQTIASLHTSDNLRSQSSMLSSHRVLRRLVHTKKQCQISQTRWTTIRQSYVWRSQRERVVVINHCCST